MADTGPIEHRDHETWQDAAARFVSDLDRCEHGRHLGDACGSCGLSSLGNPRARGEDPRTREGSPILGYSLRRTYAYVLVQPPGLFGTAVRVVPAEDTTHG